MIAGLALNIGIDQAKRFIQTSDTRPHFSGHAERVIDVENWPSRQVFAIIERWLKKGQHQKQEKEQPAGHDQQMLQPTFRLGFILHLIDQRNIGEVNLLRPSKREQMNDDRYGKGQQTPQKYRIGQYHISCLPRRMKNWTIIRLSGCLCNEKLFWRKLHSLMAL